MTAIDVPTAYPTKAFERVGTISRNARMQIAHTAYTGTRSRWETRRQSWCPGTARSREKANIIRDADVVDAIVQKICAITAIAINNSAPLLPIASCQMCWTMKA